MSCLAMAVPLLFVGSVSVVLLSCSAVVSEMHLNVWILEGMMTHRWTTCYKPRTWESVDLNGLLKANLWLCGTAASSCRLRPSEMRIWSPYTCFPRIQFSKLLFLYKSKALKHRNCSLLCIGTTHWLWVPERVWLKYKQPWLSAITHVEPELNSFSTLFLTSDSLMFCVCGVYVGYEGSKSNHAEQEWFSLPSLQADWKHQYSCDFLV